MGERFGKYELVAKLAKGGMAQTYRARLTADAGVTKEVVIKKVLPHFAEDEAFVTAFVNEARISASLSHGNIAQVFDFGRVDGDYFIAMEWIEGRSLAQMLERAAQLGFARLPVPIACFIAIEILKGLHYAHSRTGSDGAPLQIVHRDVSPENILLGFEGQTKLVDFGVAKAVLQGRAETEPGLVKGKFQYFSPEQAQALPLDARSDVFALGVVLYRMLCGELPFTGQMHVVMHAIIKGSFRPVAVVNPRVPSALALIVTRALATDRLARFPTALALQEELSTFLYRQEASFSGESVKEWMLWLFGDELRAEGKKVQLSARFETQLKKWGATVEQPLTSNGLTAEVTRPDLATPSQPSVAATRPIELRKAKWPWIAGAAVAVVAAGGVAGFARRPRAAPIAVDAPGPEEARREEKRKATDGEVRAALKPSAEQPKASPEEIVAAAYQSIGELGWDKARELLKTCTIDGQLCPDAKRLLTQLESERAIRDALIVAELALESGDLVRANELLRQCSGTKLLTKRLMALRARYDADFERSRNIAPELIRPRPIEPPKPIDPQRPVESSVTPADPMAVLVEEARALNRDRQFPAAKAKLEFCIRKAPKNAECHKVLGGVYGKMGEGERGALEYRLFLKYAAPDDPSIDRVKALLDAYDHPSR